VYGAQHLCQSGSSSAPPPLQTKKEKENLNFRLKCAKLALKPIKCWPIENNLKAPPKLFRFALSPQKCTFSKKIFWKKATETQPSQVKEQFLPLLDCS